MAINLSGQAALVTGAAGEIGRAIAERFLSKGVKVCIMDIKESLGHETTKELNAKYGKGSTCFCCGDVASEEDGKNAIHTCKEVFGKIDILVNNAGIGRLGLTYDPETDTPHDLEVFRKVIYVNAMGTFNMSRLAAKEMAGNEPNRDGQRGVIINISSITAFDAIPGLIAYSASKAAINGMTLVMARDLAPVGIRVATVCPGPADTELMRNLLDAINRPDTTSLFPKRLVATDEVAEVVELVASCKMVNGDSWRVDGAYRAP